MGAEMRKNPSKFSIRMARYLNRFSYCSSSNIHVNRSIAFRGFISMPHCPICGCKFSTMLGRTTDKLGREDFHQWQCLVKSCSNIYTTPYHDQRHGICTVCYGILFRKGHCICEGRGWLRRRKRAGMYR